MNLLPKMWIVLIDEEVKGYIYEDPDEHCKDSYE